MPTSTAGKSSSRSSQGFTLIELIVVISLISLMLFLAVPRLQDTFRDDPRRKALQWLTLKIQSAKQKALSEHLTQGLHIDIDEALMWWSNGEMTTDELAEARENGFMLPEGIRLIDVEFPESDKIAYGTVEIFFYPQGYSDKALLHLESQDGRTVSILIEPFLKTVKIFEGEAGFEETGFYTS